MKYLPLCILLFALPQTPLFAQHRFPPSSPPARIYQLVGNTNFSIEYDRPIARGRKIFGGLVPYGKLWQTGASGTTLSFDRTVDIAGFTVPPGTYALLVVPGPQEWTIIVSTADDGLLNYKPEQDLVNVCLPVNQPGRYYDSYSVELDVRQSRATLYVSWTDVQVSLPITVPARAEALAFVEQLLASPDAYDEETLFRTVNYLTFNRIHPEKALPLARHLVTLSEQEYPYRMLATIYRELHQKDLALAAVREGIARSRREFAKDPDMLRDRLRYWAEEERKAREL